MGDGNGSRSGNGGDDPVVAELRLIRAEVQQTNTRLGSLEQATLAGFRTVGERLGSMDGRLGSMDGRLESMDERLTSLEQATVGGFQAVGEQLSGIRAVAVERHLELDQRVRSLETKVNGIESRLRRPRR